jgi:hypothetical protein
MARKKRKGPAQPGGRADDRSARDREPAHDQLGPDAPRPGPVTELRGGAPRTSDEAGDVSAQTTDRPGVVREEVGNTSTSSGTHPGDSGDDQRRKEQLRRGLRNVSRMD